MMFAVTAEPRVSGTDGQGKPSDALIKFNLSLNKWKTNTSARCFETYMIIMW